MGIALHSVTAAQLAGVVDELGQWHTDDGPFQLHPGDVGWSGWHGDDRTAWALRVWTRDDQLLAVGMLDGPELLRLALAPEARRDEELAAVMAEDISTPGRGVLPEGEVDVEAPPGAVLRETLTARGWGSGDPWTHLRLDLEEPVTHVGDLRVEPVDRDLVSERTAVHRAAFGSSAFTDECWRMLAAGPAYRQARCLVGLDGDVPVAAVTVWSAGEGRPAIIEPMGVHPDHRGRGHGVSITRAGAAAVRADGASSLRVGTPSRDTRAVATYVAAGFEPWAEVEDLRRPD